MEKVSAEHTLTPLVVTGGASGLLMATCVERQLALLRHTQALRSLRAATRGRYRLARGQGLCPGTPEVHDSRTLSAFASRNPVASCCDEGLFPGASSQAEAQGVLPRSA
eukprot:779306-Amphidinium_carterae.1